MPIIPSLTKSSGKKIKNYTQIIQNNMFNQQFLLEWM